MTSKEFVNECVKSIFVEEFDGQKGKVNKYMLADLWSVIEKGFDERIVSLEVRKITPKFLSENCLIYRLLKGGIFYFGIYVPDKYYPGGISIEFSQDDFRGNFINYNFHVYKFNEYNTPKEFWSIRSKYADHKLEISPEIATEIVKNIMKETK